MDTAIQALSDRISAIEKHLGIKTVPCAGYCEQPTGEPSGMCTACQERERVELRRLRPEAVCR